MKFLLVLHYPTSYAARFLNQHTKNKLLRTRLSLNVQSHNRVDLLPDASAYPCNRHIYMTERGGKGDTFTSQTIHPITWLSEMLRTSRKEPQEIWEERSCRFATCCNCFLNHIYLCIYLSIYLFFKHAKQ